MVQVWLCPVAATVTLSVQVPLPLLPGGLLPLKVSHPAFAQLCPLESCVKLSVSVWVLRIGPKRIPSVWQPLRSLETVTTLPVPPKSFLPWFSGTS